MRPLRPWLSAAFVQALLLTGCGSPGSTSKLEADGQPTSPFDTKARCEDSTPAYVQAVEAGDYTRALQVVCQTFALPCSEHSLSPDPGLTTDFAYTNALTNHITLGAKAFTYPYCSTPHDGWLASVVAHEMLHTTQSRWDRYWAAKLGLKAATARLELPAWQLMWDRRDDFRLTTRMRIDVDGEISAYKDDLR